MCATCINDAGAQCTCLLASNTEVSMTNFKPRPVDTKTITFKKAQRKAVKIGAEKVQRQDQAMWSALTGSTTKKCLLAVTICAGMFRSAIGHSTNFFDPGVGAVKCDDAGITRLSEVIEKEDPSVIFIHAPFDTDAGNLTGFENLKNFAKTQERAERTMHHSRHQTHSQMEQKTNTVQR